MPDKLSIVLCLSILCFASVAGADDAKWKYLGPNEKGEQFYYDSASVLYISKDVLHVWIRVLSHDAPTKKLEEINCFSRIIRDLQIIVEKGNKILPIPPPVRGSAGEWRPIEKEPQMKALSKTLCR